MSNYPEMTCTQFSLQVNIVILNVIMRSYDQHKTYFRDHGCECNTSQNFQEEACSGWPLVCFHKIRNDGQVMWPAFARIILGWDIWTDNLAWKFRFDSDNFLHLYLQVHPPEGDQCTSPNQSDQWPMLITLQWVRNTDPCQDRVIPPKSWKKWRVQTDLVRLGNDYACKSRELKGNFKLWLHACLDDTHQNMRRLFQWNRDNRRGFTNTTAKSEDKLSEPRTNLPPLPADEIPAHFQSLRFHLAANVAVCLDWYLQWKGCQKLVAVVL